MIRKSLLIAIAMTFMGGTAMAQTAWTGGDELPTNPLACDGTPGTAAATPPTRPAIAQYQAAAAIPGLVNAMLIRSSAKLVMNSATGNATSIG